MGSSSTFILGLLHLFVSFSFNMLQVFQFRKIPPEIPDEKKGLGIVLNPGVNVHCPVNNGL